MAKNNEQFNQAGRGKARVEQSELDNRVPRPAVTGVHIESRVILNSNVNDAWLERQERARAERRAQYERQISRKR